MWSCFDVLVISLTSQICALSYFAVTFCKSLTLLSCFLQVCVSLCVCGREMLHTLMLMQCSETPVFTRQESSLVTPQGEG